MSPSCQFFSALWLALMLAVVAAEEQQGEGCSGSPKTCGDLSISYPFWLTNWETGRPCPSPDYEAPTAAMYRFGTPPSNWPVLLGSTPPTRTSSVYNCTEEAAAAAVARRDKELVRTSLRCGNGSNMFVRVGMRSDATGNYSGYALKGCDTVIVPVMATSGVTNTTDYEQFITDSQCFK
ncbi:hypothetical protein CFC21_033719 [Triticum aestivum]|uniref:Uncharacterized protein n=2 Tax=Triticum aestivum TaxID=4565 RepID=A0A9R1F2I2_WHEAT|nr:hypothetical protein CFC21_033719 [Triticum aestivum]